MGRDSKVVISTLVVPVVVVVVFVIVMVAQILMGHQAVVLEQAGQLIKELDQIRGFVHFAYNFYAKCIFIRG